MAADEDDGAGCVLVEFPEPGFQRFESDGLFVERDGAATVDSGLRRGPVRIGSAFSAAG